MTGSKNFKHCGLSDQSLCLIDISIHAFLRTHAFRGPLLRFPSPTHSCSIDEVGHICDEFVQQKGMKSLQLSMPQSYFCYIQMIHCFYEK